MGAALHHANEDLTIFQKHARRTSDCIINGNTDYSYVGHLSLRKITDVEYEGVNDVAPGVVVISTSFSNIGYGTPNLLLNSFRGIFKSGIR